MKQKLRMFPNGAHIVYEGVEFKKTASMVKDHFCLVPINNEKAMCLYLHRDTFVEPLMSKIQI